MSVQIIIYAGDSPAHDSPSEAEVLFEQKELVDILSQIAVNRQAAYDGSWSAAVSVTTISDPPRCFARVKLWKDPK